MSDIIERVFELDNKSGDGDETKALIEGKSAPNNLTGAKDSSRG